MRLVLTFLLTILNSLFFLMPAQPSYKITREVSDEFNDIRIIVKPQVELISVIQIIGKYKDVLGFLMSKDSSQYKTEVLNHFSSFKEHPAVLMFNRLSMKPGMLNFSAPSNIMLYTDNKLEVRIDIITEDFVTDRAGGKDSLACFLKLLKDFSVKSSFNEFFLAHNEYYRSIIQNTGKNLGKTNYIKELEDFYGKSQKSYNIVLVPLYNFVGFGNSLILPDGRREIYNTMGPKKVNEGIADFGDENYLKYMIRHEFSHPFINPLTEKYWDHIKDYSSNYDSIPVIARKNVCGDWQECVNEFTIRAITTYLALTESSENGNAAYKKEESRGISYLDPLIEKLKLYQNERSKYKTFESYYINVLDVFRK